MVVPSFPLFSFPEKSAPRDSAPRRVFLPSSGSDGLYSAAAVAAAVVAAASAFAEAVAAAAEQNQQDDDPDAAVATENTVVTHKRILLDLEFTIVYGGSAEVVTEFLRFFGYAGNVDKLSDNNDMVIFFENIVSARKRLN